LKKVAKLQIMVVRSQSLFVKNNCYKILFLIFKKHFTQPKSALLGIKKRAGLTNGSPARRKGGVFRGCGNSFNKAQCVNDGTFIHGIYSQRHYFHIRQHRSVFSSENAVTF